MDGLVLAAGSALVAPVHGRPLTAPDALAEAGLRILGHRFARPDLLAEAMTHRSAARRPSGRATGRAPGAGSNERLEFIGDRVLGLLVAEWLIERFPAEQEGELGRRLAELVAQPALAAVADATGIAALLDVAPGEDRAGVRGRATVIADATEAAIGALYLDGGLPAARHFIRTAWHGALAAQSAPPKDAKTALQEWAQARGHALPRYTVAARSGPPHNPAFTIAVHIDGPAGPVGQATGTAGSKRQAERLAATALLQALHA